MAAASDNHMLIDDDTQWKTLEIWWSCSVTCWAKWAVRFAVSAHSQGSFSYSRNIIIHCYCRAYHSVQRAPLLHPILTFKLSLVSAGSINTVVLERQHRMEDYASRLMTQLRRWLFRQPATYHCLSELLSNKWRKILMNLSSTCGRQHGGAIALPNPQEGEMFCSIARNWKEEKRRLWEGHPYCFDQCFFGEIKLCFFQLDKKSAQMISRPDVRPRNRCSWPAFVCVPFLGSITHITEDLPRQAGTRDGDAATNRMPCSNRRSTLVFSTEVVILYADNQERAWSVSSEKRDATPTRLHCQTRRSGAWWRIFLYILKPLRLCA